MRASSRHTGCNDPLLLLADDLRRRASEVCGRGDVAATWLLPPARRASPPLCCATA